MGSRISETVTPASFRIIGHNPRGDRRFSGRAWGAIIAFAAGAALVTASWQNSTVETTQPAKVSEAPFNATNFLTNFLTKVDDPAAAHINDLFVRLAAAYTDYAADDFSKESLSDPEDFIKSVFDTGAIEGVIRQYGSDDLVALAKVVNADVDQGQPLQTALIDRLSQLALEKPEEAAAIARALESRDCSNGQRCDGKELYADLEALAKSLVGSNLPDRVLGKSTYQFLPILHASISSPSGG